MEDDKFEIKSNTGYLFDNIHKNKQSHPDIRGEINIEGKLYTVAGWKKTTSKNIDFFSLSIKEKISEEEYIKKRDTKEADFIDSKVFQGTEQQVEEPNIFEQVDNETKNRTPSDLEKQIQNLFGD